ncbi:MAG: D-alanyl-D-alanine carboxypeptidase [Firmicutes bacterium]|nr:D-alanyl-D-alanine carboxypeptidase [Bacillota bacterium]
MKALRWIFVVIAALAFLTTGFQSVHADALPQVKAEAAILIDAESKIVLYEKNADRRMYPASTTKIMTALLAIEYGELDEIITIGEEVTMIGWDSSRAHLQPGDQLSLEDLLYAMMLPSGNDAAYSIAVHIVRKTAKQPQMPAATALNQFADLMNERAEILGAANTNFSNPDGYPHPNHYTTAYDLALIQAEAMKYSEYSKLDSVSQYTPETWNSDNMRTWRNTNFMLNTGSGFYYDNAIGGKTGYTVPAGFCMVATASADEMDLVAVVLKTDADGRWQDSRNLLEHGFSNFRHHVLSKQGERLAMINATAGGRRDLIGLRPKDTMATELEHGNIPAVETEILLDPELKDPKSDVPTLIAPIDEGQIVGEAVFRLKGEELERVELIADQKFPAASWLQRIFPWFRV